MKRTLGFTILAGLLLTTVARAEDEAKNGASASAGPAAKPSPLPSTTDDAARPSPGVLVAIDPLTGQFRAPTAEERRALAEGARRGLGIILRPSSIETLPDGRKRATLGPEFLRWSVVRKEADGRLSFDCVTTTNAAAAPAGAAAPSPSER